MHLGIDAGFEAKAAWGSKFWRWLSEAKTRNRHRRGWVVYAGCDSTNDNFDEALANEAGVTSGLTPLIQARDAVEVTSRRDGDTTYYFLPIMPENSHEKIALAKLMADLIHHRHEITKVSPGPLEVAVSAS